MHSLKKNCMEYKNLLCTNIDLSLHFICPQAFLSLFLNVQVKDSSCQTSQYISVVFIPFLSD